MEIANPGVPLQKSECLHYPEYKIQFAGYRSPQVEQQIFGYAITFLSIVLAIISWRNGRDMKAAVSAIQADIQASREQTARQHEDAMNLLRAIQDQMARQHEQVIGLLQAIREQTARQHEDAMALLREIHEGVERMHAETQRVLLRIAELIAAEGERTRAVLSGGRSRPQK
jgi:hypothetical protein